MEKITKIVNYEGDTFVLNLTTKQVELWDFFVENDWFPNYWKEICTSGKPDFGGD